jgi:AcrR family transcriptional regulator
MKKTRRQTRHDREREQHRQEILEAAERVFAEKGFDRATMEDVAHEAEFSVGTLYNFFDNKEALYGEVLVNIAEDFHAALCAETERKGNPLDAITGVVALRFHKMEEHGGFFRRIMEAKPGSRTFPDHAIPRSCHGRYEDYLQALAVLFKKAMAEGQVRKADPLYSALALEGAINAYWAYWRRKDVTMPIADRVETVRRNYIATIQERDH